MARKPRIFINSGVYHVVLKGIGSQLLFEDEEDREKMKEIINRYKKNIDFEIYVYVFMDNHIHFCIHDWDNKISKIMQKIEISYAAYFNKKYKRTGPLFHGRFWSRPIYSDDELFFLIKYIMGNPEKAGICRMSDFKWSSYQDYLSYSDNSITDTTYIENLVHAEYCEMNLADFFKHLKCVDFYDIKETHQMVDAKVIRQVSEILDIENPLEIMTYDRRVRNHKLRILKEKGIPVWQLVRITGISRGIIESA